jgi:hypothetical protein
MIVYTHRAGGRAVSSSSTHTPISGISAISVGSVPVMELSCKYLRPIHLVKNGVASTKNRVEVAMQCAHMVLVAVSVPSWVGSVPVSARLPSPCNALFPPAAQRPKNVRVRHGRHGCP